jgi:hypothetical protein
MSDPFSRRDALKKLALALGAAGLGEAVRPAAAAELPHLSPKEPNAVALGYHDNASQVDAQQFQTYRPGQRCDTCLQLQGQEGQPWRPCNLFPGQLVNANGWCRVWVPKS